MWRNAFVEWEGKTYPVEVKIYPRPSMFGMENGRISKCYIYFPEGEEEKDKDFLYCYERGWGWDDQDKELAAPDGLVAVIRKTFGDNESWEPPATEEQPTASRIAPNTICASAVFSFPDGRRVWQ